MIFMEPSDLHPQSSTTDWKPAQDEVLQRVCKYVLWIWDTQKRLPSQPHVQPTCYHGAKAPYSGDSMSPEWSPQHSSSTEAESRTGSITAVWSLKFLFSIRCCFLTWLHGVDHNNKAISGSLWWGLVFMEMWFSCVLQSHSSCVEAGEPCCL